MRCRRHVVAGCVLGVATAVTLGSARMGGATHAGRGYQRLFPRAFPGVDHGRTIASGPLAGVGRLNPNKAPTVHGFALPAADKADVIAFLESLTDSSFLTDTTLSNPWPGRRVR